MRSINFDTLEYMDELKRSGMKIAEAEAITKATAKAFNQMLDTKEIATKSDIRALEISMRKEISETMWKTISILATVQTIVIGAFGILQYFIK